MVHRARYTPRNGPAVKHLSFAMLKPLRDETRRDEPTPNAIAAASCTCHGSRHRSFRSSAAHCRASQRTTPSGVGRAISHTRCSRLRSLDHRTTRAIFDSAALVASRFSTHSGVRTCAASQFRRPLTPPHNESRGQLRQRRGRVHQRRSTRLHRPSVFEARVLAVANVHQGAPATSPRIQRQGQYRLTYGRAIPADSRRIRSTSLNSCQAARSCVSQ